MPRAARTRSAFPPIPPQHPTRAPRAPPAHRQSERRALVPKPLAEARRRPHPLALPAEPAVRRDEPPAHLGHAGALFRHTLEGGRHHGPTPPAPRPRPRDRPSPPPRPRPTSATSGNSFDNFSRSAVTSASPRSAASAASQSLGHQS